MTSAKHLFLTMLSIALLASAGIHLCAQTQQKPSDSASNSSSASTQGSGSKPAGPTTSTQAAPTAPATSPAPAAKPAASSDPAAKPAATQRAPLAKPTAGLQARAANGGGMVWVNTDSGVYHKPGTRWYGKTKKGKYMTEADARKAGYKPAAKE